MPSPDMLSVDLLTLSDSLRNCTCAVKRAAVLRTFSKENLQRLERVAARARANLHTTGARGYIHLMLF